MRKAAKSLIGENDFSSFRGSGCQSHSPIRTLESLKITTNNEFIYIDISANSFLLNMVRIIVGTLLLVGKGDILPSDLEDILEKRDRRFSGKTVTSDGLYFIGPTYETKFKIPDLINSLV